MFQVQAYSMNIGSHLKLNKKIQEDDNQRVEK